jgi:hypothetical protein
MGLGCIGGGIRKREVGGMTGCHGGAVGQSDVEGRDGGMATGARTSGVEEMPSAASVGDS